MKTRLQIEALPPSVNHIYRSARSKTTGKVQVYRSQEYLTWQNAVGWSVKAQMARQPKWISPVYLTVAMRRPRSNADLDNRLKPLADMLQSLGVIENDKLIHGWNAYWTDALPSGVAAEISITAADPFGLEAA
jgi:Holliday junction resolvase RusA-like endonuclease